MTRPNTSTKGANPSGLCMCGCGQRTSPATKSDRNRGDVKGQPVRYISGHHVRRTAHPYVVNPKTGCWEWQWYLTPEGYPYKADTRIKNKGQMRPAHRMYYEATKGPIPEGMHIDHLCCNRRCVNPDHLEAVTPTENTRRSSGTKLSMEQAREIRALAQAGNRYVDIAPLFRITPEMVSLIVRGKRWKETHQDT